MKIQKQPNEIRLTSTAKTVGGILLAVLCAVLGTGATVQTIRDLGSADWFDILSLTVVLIIYGVWLFTKFCTNVLRYAICFDEHGISEKRIIGKGKTVSWEHLSEYNCERTGRPYRTRAEFFQLVFVSDNAGKPILIKTEAFPESKQHIFRDEIFSFCDKHRMN